MGMIRGDLTVLGISNLLQMISANRREGYLTLQQDERKMVLHVAETGLRLVSGARRSNLLGEILIRTGFQSGVQPCTRAGQYESAPRTGGCPDNARS